MLSELGLVVDEPFLATSDSINLGNNVYKHTSYSAPRKKLNRRLKHLEAIESLLEVLRGCCHVLSCVVILSSESLSACVAS